MDADALDLINDCMNRESKLTDWELKFIQSISEQICDKPLTDSQLDTLENIWDRVT